MFEVRYPKFKRVEHLSEKELLDKFKELDIYFVNTLRCNRVVMKSEEYGVVIVRRLTE